MKKNNRYFVFIFTLISTVATAIPANNPFEKKDPIKKGVNELLQTCKKNPEMCSGVVFMLEIQDKDKVDWENFVRSAVDFQYFDQLDAEQVVQQLSKEMGFAIDELFSRGEGIERTISSSEELFGKATAMNLCVACGPEHDKEVWQKIVIAASELGDQGAGAIPNEIMEKCGAGNSQPSLESGAGESRCSGVIGVVDNEGHAIFAALPSKKSFFKDR